MIWLAWHMWLLLAGMFLLGIFMGWWIFGHHHKSTAEAEADTPEPETGRMASPEPAPAAAPVMPVTAETVKPHLYDAPTDGEPDILQKISGIGPRYEERLNDMGIYYYAQIADWTPAEVGWVDKALGFPGRVGREKWQEQARLLLLGASLGPRRPRKDAGGSDGSSAGEQG